MVLYVMNRFAGLEQTACAVYSLLSILEKTVWVIYAMGYRDEECGEEDYWSEQCVDVQDSLFRGLLQLCVMMMLTAGLVVLARVHCVFVWVIMVLALILMLFCRMPHLWMVVAASFVVSFFVGCQAGCHWLTVTTKFSIP